MHGSAIDRVCVFVAALGIAALTLRRWASLGPYPPGLDGAQWLAIGRGFHGLDRSTEGAYAPLVPLLATVLESDLGPLPALRLLATLSCLALSLAIWIVARATLGARWGLAAAAILLPATALAEPLFYGGYPQELALAAGALALWLACRYLLGGLRRDLALCAVFAIVAAATHHLYFPLVLTSIAVAAVAALSPKSPHSLTPTPTAKGEGKHALIESAPLSRRDGRGAGGEGSWGDGGCSIATRSQITSRIFSLAVALLPSIMLWGVVIARFLSKGYVAPLEGSARSPSAAWQYGARESPQLWSALLALALVTLTVSWASRLRLAWLVSAGLIVPAGLAVLFTGQPRLLPPLLIGCVIAAVWGASRLAAAHGERSRAALALATAAIALTLFFPADRAVSDIDRFYQVLDPSLVGAAAAIQQDGAPGAVVVRQDHRGWPIGWWFEALLARPIIVGSDPRWLGFPEERAHAAEANELFDGQLDPATFARGAGVIDARYLVAIKWDWIGWDRWLRRPGFPVTVLYDDDHTIVLRIEPVPIS